MDRVASDANAEATPPSDSGTLPASSALGALGAGTLLFLALLPAVLVGLLLRVRCFQAYAYALDSCGYVWAVQDGFLPHAPYLVYLWLGRLVSVFLPADVALSTISFTAGMAGIVLLCLLVHRQTRSFFATGIAGMAYAVFPATVWFSTFPEVYTPAAAVALAAMLAALGSGTRKAAWAGVLFGAAVATHTAVLFLAPAFALALMGSKRGSKARLAAATAGATLLPAAAIAYAAWVIPVAAREKVGLIGYLSGIKPEVVPDISLGASAAQALLTALDVSVGRGIPFFVLAAFALFAVVRFPRVGAFWLLYAAPYFAYETWIGWNVDPGVHALFAGPAFAALLACGVSSAAGLVRRSRRTTATGIGGMVVAIALAFAATLSWGLATRVGPRAAYLAMEPVASLLWIRDNLPEDVIVIQPPSVDNTTLVPAYSRRRPIIFLGGRFLIFDGEPGTPINLDHFSPLTDEVLSRLVSAGTTFVSLIPDPPIPASGGAVWRPIGPVYVWETAR